MSQIILSASIPASRGRVWQVVSDLQNVHLFHPDVEEADVVGDQARGVNAERICYMYNGTEQLERVTRWEEGSGFTAQVLESRLPFDRARYTIRVAPNGSDRCTVELDFQYTLRGGLMGRLSNLIWKDKIAESLERVLRGLSLHASTDVQIGPNGDADGVGQPRSWHHVKPSFVRASERPLNS